MFLKIDHRTHYRYDTPQRRIIQSLRLTPSDSEGQTVHSWSIKAKGAQLGASFVDGAGDKITTLTLSKPVTEIAIQVTGVVEVRDMAGILRGHNESVHPCVYLRETKLTEPDDALRGLAVKLTKEKEALSLDLAHALANGTSKAIEYKPGSTNHDVTAAEALAQGAGVCQDHAHVLISVARICGFPARYVTGYLHSDADGEAHEASHAWAEIHVPNLGWVGFDPANEVCPDERYLRVGSGLDAHDAAPIRGTAIGAGQEHMDVTLSVSQGQQ
jgi:transglutaminase-like putative cysteine protease